MKNVFNTISLPLILVVNSVCLANPTNKKLNLYNGTQIKLPSESAPLWEKTTSQEENLSPEALANAIASKSKLSILDVYKLVLIKDKVLSASRNAVEAAEFHYAADKSQAWGPKIKLTAGFGYGDQQVKSHATPNGSANTGGFTTTAGFTITQPIFNLPDIIQAKRSNYAAKLQEVQYAADLQTLIKKTVVAYLEVLKNRESIKFKNQEIAAAQKVLDLLIEQGKVVNMLDEIAKARARVTNAKAEKFNFEAQLKIAQGTFRQYWSVDATKIKDLKAKIKFKLPDPMNESFWTDKAMKENLVAQFKKGLIQLSDFDLQRIIEGLYTPVFSITGGCSTQQTSSSPFGSSDISTSGCSVMLNITATLFDGFYTQNKAKELYKIKAKVADEADLEAQNAGFAATTAFNNLEFGYNQIKQYESSVKDGETALAGVNERLKVGGTIVIDALTAVANLNQYRTSLLREKINFITNKVSLQLAVGNLSENDLLDIDKLLE